MVNITFTLISDQEFDPRLGYKIILKFMINIHPLNKLTKYERLFIKLVSIDTVIK